MEYLITYWQPLAILLLGILVFIFVAYTNWHKDTKTKIEYWIARNIFRNAFRSEVSANNMFTVVTSILVAFGFLSIGVAILYLTA